MQRSTQVEALRLSHMITGAVLVLVAACALLPLAPPWARWLVAALLGAGVVAAVLSEPFRRGLAQDSATSYKGLRLPDRVMLHPGHGWARSDSAGEVTAGVDDLALRALGRPDSIALPVRGALVLAGEPLFTLRRGSRSLVVHSPVTGTVAGVNDGLREDAGAIEDAPYDAGWAVRLAVNDTSAAGNGLLAGRDARDWFQAEVDRLLTTAHPGAMADGGVLVADFGAHLDQQLWSQLTEVFFDATPESRTWPRSGRRHQGGEMVGRGFYWSPADGRSVKMEACQVLPGDETRTYYRMPELAVFAMTPFAGLAYIIVFPFLAVATIVALGIQAGVVHAARIARGSEQ